MKDQNRVDCRMEIQARQVLLLVYRAVINESLFSLENHSIFLLSSASITGCGLVRPRVLPIVANGHAAVTSVGIVGDVVSL